MSGDRSVEQTYDEHYYQTGFGGSHYGREQKWLRYFGDVATHLVADLSPKTALDVGCALGMLVESLRDRGVDADGIDISTFAVSHARTDIREHLFEGSILDPFPRPLYDLVICTEVLEHVPPKEAPSAVANLCRHARQIIFSSTPIDFAEASHLNVQPREHWIELFSRHGFLPDFDYDLTFLADWGLRLRTDLDPIEALKRCERRQWRLHTENLQLREALIANRSEANLRRRIGPAAELEAIKGSKVWRFAQILRRLRHPWARRAA